MPWTVDENIVAWMWNLTNNTDIQYSMTNICW